MFSVTFTNESKRFHLFVSNRVNFIREQIRLDQWKYVPSKENPANDASRGLSLKESYKNQRWISGPEFLQKKEEEWPSQPKKFSVNNTREVKSLKINTIMTEEKNDVLERLERITNSWPRMKKIIAFVLHWKMKVKSINVLEKAERVIIRLVQKDAFPEEMKNLTDGNL